MIIRINLLLLFISNVIAYKTIVDVLSEQERFSALLQSIQENRLVPLINKLESGTLFAPDNDAFKKYDKNLTRSELLYHLIKKGIASNDFYDGQLKESLYVLPGYLGPDKSQDGQRIKVTKSSNSKIYVNQAKIIEKDIQVNNETYIQVIDRVLEPPSLIGDTIKSRNQAIHDLMEQTDVAKLVQEKKPFTVFLSTKKESLDKFNTIESNYLTSKYGKDDLSYLFKYTIIDKAIFMDDFNSGKTTFKSLTNDSLVIASNKDKKSITVNDIPLVQTDILAANGVIHEVDETFKPEGIEFNTRKYMYGSNATHMVELFDKYDLANYVDHTENSYTFLVPPNDAINASLISKSWLSYHIVNGSWPQENLKDEMLLASQFKSSDLGGNYQRLPVYVETENIYGQGGQSIQFDRARVVGESVNIHDDMIYQIAEPLSLPGDILGKLVLDLDLSTFLATLYVSEVGDEIKNTKGLTLFAPTNEAFTNLGLVAKYLVHPTAKSQLQNVLRYHAAAANTLLYHDDMKNGVHEILTLANSTLRISQNKSGAVVVGRPEAGTGAVLTHTNMLVSNGVIHKISDVQIPNQVKITNKDLLVGIEAKTMIQILEKANLLDKINQDNMVVLAPSDKAFSHVDLDALFENQDQLERLAKLHVIPKPWQDRWIESSPRDKSEYPTLLSDDDKVTIRENEKGELFIEVKNGGDSDRAHVTGLGRVSAGGGIIAIDAVLTPIRRGFFGLPWIWSLVVTLTIIIITGGVLSIVGFFGYKIYNRRRLGYRPIF